MSAFCNTAIQVAARGSNFLRVLPCFFHLGDDLGFAYYHGVEAGSHAEDMQEGGFIEQAVEVFPLAELESAGGGKQAHDRVGGEGNIAGPQPKLGAGAGGEYDHLFDSFGAGQLRQGIVTAALVDPEALAHGHWSGTVVEPHDH